MKTKLIALTMLIALALATTSYAEIPHVINFQGKATDEAGNPLNSGTDGPYNLTFRIYSHETEGEPIDALWTEPHENVTITNGIFNVLLGGITALDLSFDEDYWLSVEVNTDGEMSPRTRLASVGYAHKAETADYAITAGTAQGIDTTEVIDAKGGLVIETRTSDPADPVTGQIWLRTDK